MVLHGDVTLEQSPKDLDWTFLIFKQFIATFYALTQYY